MITKHNIPGRQWDFVLDYVMVTMNVTINYSRYYDGRVPLEVVTGVTPNITEYLDFDIYGWVFFRTEGGLGTNEIGRWLGVSHRIRPMMTYWVLPKSGIPISTDTVQAVTQAELQTDAVKEQMESWKAVQKRNYTAVLMLLIGAKMKSLSDKYLITITQKPNSSGTSTCLSALKP